MGVSGRRSAAEINLDELERWLGAAGTEQASAEGAIVEMARRLAPLRWSPYAEAVSEPGRTDTEPTQPLETAMLRPPIDEMPDDPSEAATIDVEAKQTSEFDDTDSHLPNEAELAAERRSGGWKLKVSALTLVGVAMTGAIFALKGDALGLPKSPPVIAAAQGLTKVQPSSDENVATSGDAGATLLKDSTQPGSEEQPIDLNAQALLGNMLPPAAFAPAADGPAQPTAGVSGGTVNTPVVAALIAPMASQFPDPKPVRAVSLRPDGTPIATATPSATDSRKAAQASDAPKPPARPAPKAARETAGTAQPSTPKLDLPTKLSAKSSARVVVAKTDTTALGATAETPSPPVRPGAPVKPEKAARAAPKAPQAAAEPSTAPPAPAVLAQQSVNPLAPAFGELVGSLAVRAASAQQPVDPTAATTSSDWAVQLAAPKSDTEAKSDAARLSAKYVSALNGAAIGVHKAQVNGATIYRLRVVGLSKADAAALCARLKRDGGDCFTAKEGRRAAAARRGARFPGKPDAEGSNLRLREPGDGH